MRDISSAAVRCHFMNDTELDVIIKWEINYCLNYTIDTDKNYIT